MTDRLKIGLIGAGVFAGYHANKLAAHPRVIFTGVVDNNSVKANDLALCHKVECLPLERLLEKSDAVVIASPATTHDSIAIQALTAGCHCLIEKPLAISAQAADDIIGLAAEKKLTVQVGHQERLVLRAIGLMDVPERPIAIEAVRNSPFSPRGTDTSVTMDLMTHDIDLCTTLLRAAPVEIKGQVERIRSRHVDKSEAVLKYDNCTARLKSSRVEDVSNRQMKITYPSGVVAIDFNAKTLSHSTPFALNADFADDARAKDSLGAATDIFVRAVLDNAPVLVTAEEGAIAVLVALQIDGA